MISKSVWLVNRADGVQLKLLLATRNPGKLREYRDILGELPLELLSLADVQMDVPVPETGASYAENARLKAETYSRLSGLCTLADDSGLEVDALGGRPGVHSARYGVPGLNDAEKVALLLSELAGVPWEHRTATFRAAIAIVCPDGRSWICEGRCAGYIAPRPAGSSGFGYDPIFYVPALGATMAQLPGAEKNRVSHRAEAARGAKRVLARRLASALD